MCFFFKIIFFYCYCNLFLSLLFITDLYLHYSCVNHSENCNNAVPCRKTLVTMHMYVLYKANIYILCKTNLCIHLNPLRLEYLFIITVITLNAM